MRFVLIGLAVLIALVVAAAFVAPSLIPSSVYRDQIAEAVEKATGRQFTISGDVSLRILPTVRARVEKASLGNAPGGEAKTMAEIGRLDVGLALIPLLSRRAEITSFVLNDAVIHLEVAEDGKPNWEFEKAADGGTAKSEAGSGAKQSELSEMSLGDVRLANGLITYANLKTGDRHELRNINSKIELPSLDKPLKINGDASYNGEKLLLAVEIARARAALEGGTTGVSAKIDGAPLAASFAGDVTFDQKMNLVGDAKLDVPSIRRLSGWVGNPMPAGKGFGPLSLAGRVSYTGEDLNFTDVTLRFDEIQATGSLKATLGGPVPYIAAKLATDALDLRPYIEESKKPVGGGSGGAGAPAASSAAWSTEPIDTSALKAFNADMSFSAAKIFVRDLKIDRGEIGLKVNGGVLTANLKELALYGGKGTGTVTLNASGARPQIASDLALSGLDLASFMRDAAKTDRLEGTGAFNIDVRGGGVSQKEIVSSLAGSAAIDFKNGAIKGVDLVKVANAVNTLLGKNQEVDQAQAQAATDEAQGSDEKTRFVAMGGTFQIAGGVATTSDLKMLNDLISLTGRGSIDLPAQTLNLRVEPGRDENNNMKVALAITGPLAKPKIAPDPTGLIRDQFGKALGKLLGDKDSETRDQGGETGATTQEQAPSPAEQILEQIFGR